MKDYFTLQGYRRIVERAVSLEYRIVCFREFETPSSRPVLVLRHDLDHSIACVRVIAELEATLGVHSTFFVQTACPFYNLLAPSSRADLRAIANLGHELGLHYEPARYTGARGQDRMLLELALLADIAGHEISSASRHLPVDSEVITLPPVITREAYSRELTSGAMHYISDSLMQWRGVTPDELLDRRASFQFLSHPMQWVHHESVDLNQALARAADEERRRVDRVYVDVGEYYQRLLRDRVELDRRFVERQTRLGSS